ncbi:gametocyte-specific factor 1 homolog [Culex quinquefasciatus]|uniref:gametocyte-specific factor 1 homolog n=1 Tax=Culex quinquefasciatus TaxID=7176 RepID=UPI0018E3E802|nr:gametocyte-specific factor 1 homolog [Culex quinquefasciatus]
MSLVEDLLFCPYNRAHRIRPDAMPKHLYKCRRNHPKTRLVICPFNTIHHVSGPELNAHIAECPDRAAFELYKYCITDGSRQSHTPTAQEPELIYNNEPPRQATGRSLQDDDECWDESAVPAYNPHAYCKSANVIRKATNMKKSQKREFYQAERERLNGWRSGSTSSESDDGCQKATTLAGADEWWDDEVAPAKDNRATVEKKQDMDAMSASFAQKLKMNQ